MAKAQGSKEEKKKDDLLTGLRKGLDGQSLLLTAPRGEGAFFLGGKAGKDLAEEAIREGYLEEVRPPVQAGKKKRSPPTYARLTEKGRQFIIDQDSPKKLLEDLFPVVTSLAQKVAEGGQTSPTQQGEGLGRIIAEQLGQLPIASLQQTIQSSFEKLQQTIEAKLAKPLQQMQTNLLQAVEGLRTPGEAPPAQRLASVLQTVHEAIEQANTQFAVPPPVPPPLTSSPPEMDWLNEVVQMVAEQKQRNQYKQLSFPEIYTTLKTRRPELTLGEFHEGLRTLHAQRQITLWPYTLALATIEDPQNALYLDREVKYYVDLP